MRSPGGVGVRVLSRGLGRSPLPPFPSSDTGKLWETSRFHRTKLKTIAMDSKQVNYGNRRF